MNSLEFFIWTMALGAIAGVAVARGCDAIARPSRSQWRGATYHLGVFLFVLVMSGVLDHLLAPRQDLFLAAQVLAGPACVGLSNLWIRRWLAARQRDRLMSVSLGASAIALPLAGFAALALAPYLQLPVAAAASLFGSTLTLWMVVRAWLMGDRLALVMAGGCLLTLPAIAGMYQMAAGLAGFDAGKQAFAAMCAALGNSLTGLALWRRDRHERQALLLDGGVSRFDPVTRLPTGAALVRTLLAAQQRRRHTRREGAIVAVIVFDVHKLAAHLGAAGTNELYIAIAGRLQRRVGVVNPVGRYWDRCFVTMVESIHSRASLRTLGLRVATSLRHPFEVTHLDGSRAMVRVDIGVGLVHLARRAAHVEDILDDAQRMAEAARALASRAAIMDPSTGDAVAVESADLGPRRRKPARGGAPALAAAR